MAPRSRLYTPLTLAVLALVVGPIGIAVFVLGFGHGDSPCVLCWAQRTGMVLIALTGLFVIRFGPRPRYIGMAVLLASFGLYMGLRHSSLHLWRDVGQGFSAEIFGDDSGIATANVPDGRPDLFIENFFLNRVFRLGNFNSQSYRGLEMELIKRLSRKWQMQASYTYSRSKGDAESFLSENGDDPSLTEFESGFLDYDQRHVVKVNAIAYLPGEWRLGGTAQWASGLPYSVVDEFDALDNVGYSQSRRLFGYVHPTRGFITEHRNSHRNHAAYNFNVRTEKSFVLGKTSASAFFEVFNLLNSDDLRVYTLNPGRSSLQADEERRFGRRFQIGVRLDF